MTLRYVFGVVTAIVIGCGVSMGLANAQQRDGGLLPPEGGMVTVAGCLMRGDQIRGGDSDKYVLANVTPGPVNSVPEQTCSADAGAKAVQLDHPKKGDINESMLGRWVEISGRLEKETSKDDTLRELDVRAARLLPVEIPRRAEAVSAPEPIAEPEPTPEPVPVATSGQAPAAPALPKTASPVPLAGLIGLFACAGSLALRSLRSRQRA